MKTKWMKVSLAACGAIAFLFAAQVRAQQTLTTNRAEGFGAEYTVFFEWLGKISQALQGSTDQNSTANNLAGLPQATGVDINAYTATNNNISANNNYTTTKLLSTSDSSRDGRGAAFFTWFFSKDFNVDDPFESFFKDRKIDRNNEIDVATEGIDSPPFTFMVGFTQALSQSLNNKDGKDNDNTDFNALTFPVETSKD